MNQTKSVTHHRFKVLYHPPLLQSPHITLVIALCLLWCLTACSVNKKNQTAMPKSDNPHVNKLTVITDINQNSIELNYNPTDSILNIAAKQSGQLPILIGVLGVNFDLHPVSSVLNMNGWDVPLTGIRMMEARGLTPIVILPEQAGKLALVQGHLSGSTLYQANIIAVFSESPTQMLYQLLQNNCPDISPFLNDNY